MNPLATTVRGLAAGTVLSIVGASLLGAETADALTGLGHEVFLIGAPANPMTRQLGTTIATWVRARHAEHLRGVLDARVDSVSARGDDVVLALGDGTELTVDLVIEKYEAAQDRMTGKFSGTLRSKAGKELKVEVRGLQGSVSRIATSGANSRITFSFY